MINSISASNYMLFLLIFCPHSLLITQNVRDDVLLFLFLSNIPHSVSSDSYFWLASHPFSPYSPPLSLCTFDTPPPLVINPSIALVQKECSVRSSRHNQNSFHFPLISLPSDEVDDEDDAPSTSLRLPKRRHEFNLCLLSFDPLLLFICCSSSSFP